jgi:signal transduction histidine kinase
MRRRILWSMVLVTAAAVAAFAIPLSVAASRLQRSREVNRLERIATQAGGSLPSDAAPNDPVDLPAAPARVHLSLYDHLGNLIAGDGPRTVDASVRAALEGRVHDQHEGTWLVVAVPVLHQERVTGVARAATPWNALSHETEETALLMFAIGLGAVALAGALAWWQSSRLVAPVEGVARLAVRLGDGDFSARLPAAGVEELDRAVEALNRTAERLGELVSRERAFTADVSHQLTTPLTSLRLGLESALVAPNGDGDRALQDALAEVERLQSTVATLLAVAHDAQPAIDARADVLAVSTDVADRFRGGLAAAGRPVRVAADPALPPARIPADVLREILTVLVDNAGRHGTGAVTIAARAAGNGLIVDVSDEGQGIAGDPARLFERRSPDAAGHGIGLALARSLAEAHEARLQVSQAGPHPVFTVALPGAPPQ